MRGVREALIDTNGTGMPLFKNSKIVSANLWWWPRIIEWLPQPPTIQGFRQDRSP
jgi:hypothetical protein